MLKDDAVFACLKTRILNTNRGTKSREISNCDLTATIVSFQISHGQPTEVLFSHKRDKVSHPPLTFSNNKIQYTSSQKYLGLVLNSERDFNRHIEDKIDACNKIIGIIKRLSMTLFRNILLTIYKSFVRAFIGYVDIIYDKPFDEPFIRKFEAVKYNASLVVARAGANTYRKCVYHEYFLESLSYCKWSCKSFFFP